MGFLARLLGTETRGETARLADPYLAEWFGMRGSGHGGHTPESALSALAVAARCTALIAESLAAVPLRVYRWNPDGGRELATDNPLDAVLSDLSSPGVAAFELREALVRDVAMHGNAFARVVRDGRGRVAELHHHLARGVTVERLASGRLRYRVADERGRVAILLAEEVAHLRYASRDGVLGLSPLAWAPGAVSLAVAQSDLAHAQADRGFVPDLSFETDAVFDDARGGDQANAAFRRLKDQLTDRVTKMRGGISPLLLEAGLKAKPLATPGREAQFMEARTLGLADIARLYGVPLSVVGLGATSSYGSLNEEARALVRDCLAPWARRIEAQLSRSLLTAEGRKTLSIEHDLSGLLRGDQDARFRSYATGLQWGFLSPNDVRRSEGLNAILGGDTYMRPLNMAPGGNDGQA